MTACRIRVPAGFCPVPVIRCVRALPLPFLSVWLGMIRHMPRVPNPLPSLKGEKHYFQLKRVSVLFRFVFFLCVCVLKIMNNLIVKLLC